MKKRVKRNYADFGLVTCPFCGGTVKAHVLNQNMPWCVGCRVEWYFTGSGNSVVFDDQRKTERFAWGKAMNAMGGMRIGGKVEKS